jgi:hypothetical protein
MFDMLKNLKKKPIFGNSEAFETTATLILNTEIGMITLCTTLYCYVEMNHTSLSGKMGVWVPIQCFLLCRSSWQSCYH